MTIALQHRARPTMPFPVARMTARLRDVTQNHGPARGHRYTLANPTAPAAARELVRRHAPATVADDAALAASELATNAAVHAGGADRVTLTVTATWLILSVTDHRPDMPVSRPVPGAEFDLGTESGRGLAIICALGFELAVRRAAASKRVTVRLPIGGES